MYTKFESIKVEVLYKTDTPIEIKNNNRCKWKLSIAGTMPGQYLYKYIRRFKSLDEAKTSIELLNKKLMKRNKEVS